MDIIIGGHSHTFLNSPDSEGGPIFDKTKSNITRKNCVDKFACDEPSGPFPTVVKTKQCAPNKATGGRIVCGTKNVPVVQAFYASKCAFGFCSGFVWGARGGGAAVCESVV